MSSLCIRQERIANEILMYFRSRKKLQGEVSLSDSIETDQDGNDLMLMDVVGVDDTMLSDLQDREDSVLVRRLVRECLTDREREIVTLRYGLGGRMPRTQREIAKKLGISRSYVSRIEKRALEKLRSLPQEQYVELLAALLSGDIGRVANHLDNVFDPVVTADHLELNYIKSICNSYGSLGQQMTGSGSAVFAIMPSFEYGAVVCNMLKENYSEIFLAKPV